MKIGVDATALVRQRTGVGNYVYPILEALCARHPDSTFLLYSNDTVHFGERQNVRLRVSRPKRRGPWWQCTQLRQMLVADQPDVYWGTNGLLPFPGVAGVATVLTVHDFVYHFAGQSLPRVSYWGRRLFQPQAVRQADRIVAVSQATAADLERLSGRTVHAVVPPSVSPAFRHVGAAECERVRRKLDLPPVFLLSLGTREPRKNLIALLSAHEQVSRLEPALPPLLVAGGGGWKNAGILDALAAGQASGTVRPLGFVDAGDLPALYALCQAFVMPSVYEGFGMPLLEAQACGAPVIHGPHASMHEAAGGLGVVTGTSVDALRRTLQDVATGNAPLACRLMPDGPDPATAAADRLWQAFVEVAGMKRGRS